MSDKKYELIKITDGEFSLDVKVSPEENTVWLNAKEIAIMFERDYKTILKHIDKILEDELDNSTVAFFATVASNGKKYNIAYYNLDMIISVGYRVKSKRGIQFRRWANQILKQYLLNGFVINKDRVMTYDFNIIKLEAEVHSIDMRLKDLEETVYSNNTQIIFEGEILEPYTFLRKLFFLAKSSITIIDQYADKFLLTMLSDLKIKIYIITSTNSYINKETIPSNISIIHNDIIHDRFIIIDDSVYLIGTSINDIGKKRFVITKLESITKDMLLKVIK